MQFVARHKNASVSAHKARLVVDLIRGRHVNDALLLLRSVPRKSSVLVDKVLRSAMANADQSLEADMDSLRVKRVWVDEGRMRRKWRAASRGRAMTIRGRTCHINIVLDDGK